MKIQANTGLRIASIDEYKKALSQTDAILEQNIYTDALSEYLKLGGAPMDAVNLLSESYIGIPSMCNATAKSVDSIGLSSDIILRKAIRHQLKNRFDPQRCDEFFMQLNDQMAPEWLDVILEDIHWRQTFYELLEKYPNCVFLNFAILVSCIFQNCIFLYLCIIFISVLLRQVMIKKSLN
jgi:hypothetical protein